MLFEVFVARLLHAYGYEEPTTRNLNVTADGIELDVVARSRLTEKVAIAECKAYTRPVSAKELTNFYGKLSVERFDDPDTFGLIAVLPRLTPEGEEKAKAIRVKDKRFLYLSSHDIATRLLEEKLISPPPAEMGLVSDPAVVITSEGIFAASIRLDQDTRVPTEVLTWAVTGRVPPTTMNLIGSDEYAQGLPVRDARSPSPPTPIGPGSDPLDAPILVQVKGSGGDFEYQLPASPRYFVGRKTPVKHLRKILQRGAGAVVLNAQSGWGKSSLALKFADVARQQGGYALVLDSRTANDPRFVIEAVRRGAIEAASQDLLSLPANASWASLASCLGTLEGSSWLNDSKPFLIFFDQFENVFKSESLTRSFRDLSTGVRELSVPLVVGFAWKTDLVGWTEGHPFQLRDEIRANSTVLAVEPFDSNEVSTLLGRLERELHEKLSPDLRSRLREYSQGLPWLLKKLSDHVLREIRSGVTQEQLIAEALNVQGLFDADLAELSPPEQETIKYAARYAPLPASEVTERFGPEAIQSLVDRRLLVQIGERLDTYWDTFRDYLNTGRVPVEDSYILRQTPNSVARLLPLVIRAGGSIGVKELREELQTSTNVVFNLSRELRLLGMTVYDPNRVTIVDEILTSTTREAVLRRHVAQALKRHKAYSTLIALADRSGGSATAAAFADELPRAFPAVAVKRITWNRYARVYLAWFAYAGLARELAGRWSPRPDGDAESTTRLLSKRPIMRTKPAIPQEHPRHSLEILRDLGKRVVVSLPPDRSPYRDAVRTLLALGAVEVDHDATVRLARKDLVDEHGIVNGQALLELLESVPGGRQGLEHLRRNPGAPPSTLGTTVREAIGASWTDWSTHGVGSALRAWARHAGLRVKPVPRKSPNDLSARPGGPLQLDLLQASGEDIDL